MPKRCNFIAPLLALIQENIYLLTYCTVFHFYGTLSSFHHDIEAEEGVPPIVSWEFEQITWETRLTQHANFLQASQQNPFLENQLSIIHEESQVQRNPDPKRNISIIHYYKYNTI